MADVPDTESDLAATIGAAFDAAGGDDTAPDAPDAADVRARDELGRFAAKAGDDDEAAALAGKPSITPESADGGSPVDAPPGKAAVEAPSVEGQPKAPAAVSVAPPPGWSIAAKQKWDALDPAVRDAIAEREVQVNNGLAKLAEFKGLEPFQQLAQQYGVSLADAMNSYVSAEHRLMTEPVMALRWLCQRYGVDPSQLSQSQEASGDQNPTASIDPLVYQLANEVNALKSAFVGQTQSAVNSEISAFAGDPKHRFFENVKPIMGVLIGTGQANDILDAYDKACWANPEIRAVLINEQQTERQRLTETAARATASKARQAGKSIAGAANGATAPAPVRSLHDDISAAYDSFS